MAKLPKRLIKKYGISKKAWSVFKAEKRSTTSKPKLKRGKTMTKKRRAAPRRKARKTSTGFKLPSGTTSMIAAVGYGFLRDKVSDALARTELIKKLPITNFTDEGVMLALNFGARKLGLGKMKGVNSLLTAQKTIELARVGETISDMKQVKTSGNAQGIFIN